MEKLGSTFPGDVQKIAKGLKFETRSEGHLIVTKVEQLLALPDALETRLATSRATATTVSPPRRRAHQPRHRLTRMSEAPSFISFSGVPLCSAPPKEAHGRVAKEPD